MIGRSPQQRHSGRVFLRRSVVAATLLVSLLSALIPLTVASSVHMCAMECCAGKAPHLAGACSTGFMKNGPKVSQEPEILCGLHVHVGSHHLTATRLVPWQSIETGGDDDDTGSCGTDHAEFSNPDISSGTTKAKSPGSSSIAAPSMTISCSADCGPCAGVYLRRPRPREQAAVAWAGQARAPSISHCLRDYSSQTITLSGHFAQPQPRGPPLS